MAKRYLIDIGNDVLGPPNEQQWQHLRVEELWVGENNQVRKATIEEWVQGRIEAQDEFNRERMAREAKAQAERRSSRTIGAVICAVVAGLVLWAMNSDGSNGSEPGFCPYQQTDC